MTTQPQSPSEQEIRAQIAGILGAETDPNGIPEQYLIRNEAGRVINGIDFKPEIDGLEALIAQAADKREQAGRISELESLLLDYHGATVPVEPIQRRLAQLRQGRAAEGEGKNA